MNTFKMLAGTMIVGVSAAMGCSAPGANDPDPQVALMADSAGSGEAWADISYGSIPRNAMRVSSGRGILRFRVGRDGTVWVGDDDAKRELLEVQVKLDDVAEADPYADQIKLNGHVVSNQMLDKNHRHSIFYLDARKRPKME